MSLALRSRLVAVRALGRFVCLAAALSIAASGCGGSQPPSGSAEPAPPQLAPAAPPAQASAAKPEADAGAAARFADVRDRTIDALLTDEPSLGRMVGLHEFDGKIADYSAAGVAARIERLRHEREELAAIPEAGLSPDDALDRALLLGYIDLSLFKLVDLEAPKRRPDFYDEMFAVNVYLDRDYAPIVERAKKLLEHEKAGLDQVRNIRANLASPLSKPVIETAAKIYKGYAEYLRGDVKKLMKGVGDAAFQESFAKTNEALAKEAADLSAHLTKDELPKGDASHVLGKAKYEKLLLVQEGIKTPLDEFKAVGEKNLAINKHAYEELRPKVKITRPKASTLLSAATHLMDDSRSFVVQKKIITLPTDDRAQLKETPPYMRWNSAFLDPPGPFETAKAAYYYMTMPDKSWPAKEQEEYVMTFGILLSTTVHEVYPGHFVQGQWIKKAPTRAQKIFGSYSFVEGWAHYTEEMMIQEGFGAEDPQNRLGQLSDALLRNCRYVVSLGVHTEGMTLADAEKRFMNDCFQDKATAREQAVRATFDPGYFAYTLGKIQILDLRDEAKKALGEKFRLQAFHDELLSHGSPPIALIRKRVLDALTKGSSSASTSAMGGGAKTSH